MQEEGKHDACCAKGTPYIHMLGVYAILMQVPLLAVTVLHAGMLAAAGVYTYRACGLCRYMLRRWCGLWVGRPVAAELHCPAAKGASERGRTAVASATQRLDRMAGWLVVSIAEGWPLQGGWGVQLAARCCCPTRAL